MKMGIIRELCVSAALLILAGCATTEQSSERSRLQGTWKGPEVHGRNDGDAVLKISGNHLMFTGPDTNEWYKATFNLREDVTPHRVSALITDCPDPRYKGRTAQALYKLEGETLTITGNEPGRPDFPDSFDAAGAREFVLKKVSR
jgi:uncharacterized protein (TIGR03067 family)